MKMYVQSHLCFSFLRFFMLHGRSTTSAMRFRALHIHKHRHRTPLIPIQIYIIERASRTTSSRPLRRRTISSTSRETKRHVGHAARSLRLLTTTHMPSCWLPSSCRGSCYPLRTRTLPRWEQRACAWTAFKVSMIHNVYDDSLADGVLQTSAQGLWVRQSEGTVTTWASRASPRSGVRQRLVG